MPAAIDSVDPGRSDVRRATRVKADVVYHTPCPVRVGRLTEDGRILYDDE